MPNKLHSFVPKLLPLLLTFYGGTALAFEPIKFEDGTVLDISMQVSYANMKRLKAPNTINDYRYKPTSPQNSVVNPSWPFKGSLWQPAVDIFTQVETKVNTDDGDNAVGRHGTISNRVSALIDINLTKDDYRAFLRANSFRDESLYKSNANEAHGTFNGIGPSDQYTDEARRLLGQRTRVLDAYVQGRWKLGENGGNPLLVKVGRQVLNWGEGLFFQGIGSSMNPNDQVKGMTPGVPAQEAFLPTEQIYATLGVNDKLTLMGYKKWKFHETEQAPFGTYFSPTDFSTPGANFQLAFPWSALNIPAGSYGAVRGPDLGKTAKDQWGLGLKYQLTEKLDVGLYHLRYTESVGQSVFGFSSTYGKLGGGKVSLVNPTSPFPDGANAATLDALNLLTPYTSNFNVRYMNDIKLTGGSFSTVFGDYSVAGEVAYRSGAPIIMNNLHYDLAPGRLLNANLSALRIWSGNDFLFGYTGAKQAVLGGELAFEHLIGFDVPYYAVAPWQATWARGPAEPRFDRNALASVVRLELSYAPFPEWELSVPMFYWREFIGAGAMQGGWSSGLVGKDNARASIETKFTYRQNLELGMTLTYFLGEPDVRSHTMNPFQDRSFVSFNGTYHF